MPQCAGYYILYYAPMCGLLYIVLYGFAIYFFYLIYSGVQCRIYLNPHRNVAFGDFKTLHNSDMHILYMHIGISGHNIFLGRRLRVFYCADSPPVQVGGPSVIQQGRNGPDIFRFPKDRRSHAVM